MKTPITVSIALHCLALQLVHAAPELKGTPAELTLHLRDLPRTVVIVGEGEVRAPADQAAITLKVTTEHKSLNEALRYNQDVRSRITALLKNRGIPQDHIHGGRFASTPKFGLFGDKAKSYRVENLVRVSAQDEKEFQTVAGAVDGFPEVQFISAEFEHRDKEALKGKALEQACDNATRKSKLFEQKLGVILRADGFSTGEISQISNTGRPDYAYSERKLATSYSSTPLPSASSAPLAGVETEVSAFGDLVYRVQVHVEYVVEHKEKMAPSK